MDICGQAIHRFCCSSEPVRVTVHIPSRPRASRSDAEHLRLPARAEVLVAVDRKELDLIHPILRRCVGADAMPQQMIIDSPTYCSTGLSRIQQRFGGMTSEESRDGICHKCEHVSLLLTAGLDHRQKCFDKSASGRTLCPETQLAPNDGVAQRSFGRVVCRLDAFLIQEPGIGADAWAGQIASFGKTGLHGTSLIAGF